MTRFVFPTFVLTRVATLPGVFVPCREYFQPDRPTNIRPMYIGAGMGRTGTTSMFNHALSFGMAAYHAQPPTTHLPAMSYLDGETGHNFSAVIPQGGPPVAFLDAPVGHFVWDIADAFPDHRIAVTVRQVTPIYECAYSPFV